MKLYDSLTRNKKNLTRNKHEIKIYLCGPTVQASPHIGHMRGAIIFDVLKRWLEFNNKKVILCRNITDIDDKILKKAIDTNVSWKNITTKYTAEFEKAFENLNIIKPNFEPKATQNIDEMVNFVKKLIDKGYAYISNTGNIYFNTSLYKNYGELTNQKISDTEIDESEKFLKDKKNPHDFVLFKLHKKTEPNDAKWKTPCGFLRPGWHIECSAMALKYLGEQFDIHGGGLDLRFPHHENELAQSKSAGYKFANIWMHHGWVTQKGEKMSKSLGTGLSVNKFDNPVALRWALLQAHYKSNLDFSIEIYQNSVKTIDRFLSFYENDKNLSSTNTTISTDFKNALNNDLNIPLAISAIYKDIKEKKYDFALNELNILGIDLSRVPKNNSEKLKISKKKLDNLIKQRQIAKENKDFSTADKIRDNLATKGIELIDTANGTKYTIKSE